MSATRRLERSAAAAAVWAAAALTASAQGLPERVAQRLPACAACHGADGHAPLAGVPSLAGQPRLYIENRLVMIREGLSEVPAMKAKLDGLDDPELIALARHLAALPMKPERALRDTARAARGAATAQRGLCATCHLPDYSGREQLPRLAGQREDYLLKSMRDFAAGRTAGRDTLMTNALLGLNDADLQDLAHHLATFPASPAIAP